MPTSSKLLLLPLIVGTLMPAFAVAQNCGGPVLPPHVRAGDAFGTSAAWDGDYAVVGAPGTDRPATNVGAAHVLRLQGAGVLKHDAELLVTNGTPGQGFGTAVAIDGTRIAVGGPDVGAGEVRIFERIGGQWLKTQTLTHVGGLTGDAFGAALAMDGNLLVVGAPGRDTGAGAVLLFQRNGAGYVQIQELAAAAPVTNERLGASVAVSNDVILAGAPGAGSGRVIMFTIGFAGWGQSQVLLPSGASALQEFGAAVALDGELAVIGAPGDTQVGVDAGAAFVFREVGGLFLEEAKLGPGLFIAGARFGTAVDCEAAFDTVVVGAPDTGVGRVFGFGGSGAGWFLHAVDAPPDGALLDRFGASVALEGNAVLGGTPGHDSVGRDGGQASGFTLIGDCAANAAFCGGDGSGTPCPCGNHGLVNDGCANSLNRGATLISSGFSSISSDTLSFGGWNLRPGQPALLFVGSNDVGGGNGAPFGDGLRCVGGNVLRLGVRTPDTFGYAEWGPGGLTATSSGGSGGLRFFQVWYRDNTGPCGSGFNLTNAWVRVIFP